VCVCIYIYIHTHTHTHTHMHKVILEQRLVFWGATVWVIVRRNVSCLIVNAPELELFESTSAKAL